MGRKTGGGGVKRLIVMIMALVLLTGCGSQMPPLEKNPYGPEDFSWEDGVMTCLAGSARMGVDVSSYQEQIDWETAAAAGVEFAIIRIGYRGYTEGGIIEDRYARVNLEAAKAAGIEVGAYFFSQAISTEEAAEEARWCVDFLKDYELDLPLAFDWEHVGDPQARTAGIRNRTLLTECAKTFLGIAREAGYGTMLYFNTYQSRLLFNLRQLQDHDFWLAQYTDTMDFPYAVDLWQYTETGTVDGIPGMVDIDLWLPGAAE